jgi:hypothetical protein
VVEWHSNIALPVVLQACIALALVSFLAVAAAVVVVLHAIEFDFVLASRCQVRLTRVANQK